MIRPEQFEEKIGTKKIADFVRDEVLRLSYTAHDLEPFARDLGYDGPPFTWDEDDRRHRMARLDALFFQLYGLTRDDAAYILDTFPIVREEDEKAFGRFNHFVSSIVAPVASGWSGCRVGLAPNGKAPPYHGARQKRTLPRPARSIIRACLTMS